MARGETIAGLDIGTTKTCAVVAASGPDGLEIIGIGEAPSTGMRKGVVTDLEETVRAIEAATEKAERMAGRAHLARVRRRDRRAHAVDQQPRRRAGLRRRSRGHWRRRAARRRRLEDHQPRRRPSDHSRAAASLHDRRSRRRDRSRRHVRRPARSRHAHRHRRIDLHLQRAQVRSPRRAGDRRHRVRTARVVGGDAARRRETSRRASCSTSAAARPTSRFSPTAASCTSRRFRSAATSSPTTSRSGSRRRSPKRRT